MASIVSHEINPQEQMHRAFQQASKQLQQVPCHEKIMGLVGTISGLAIFILSACAAAGCISGNVLGASMIGFGAGTYLLGLPQSIKQHKVVQITLACTALLMIVMGALGCCGILSGTQLGGTSLGFHIVSSVITMCVVKKYVPVPRTDL